VQLCINYTVYFEFRWLIRLAGIKLDDDMALQACWQKDPQCSEPIYPPWPILLTDDDVTASPPALIRVGLETLPAAIAAAGADTSERFIEFFTANIPHRNTRMAYALGVRSVFRLVRATLRAAGRYQAHERGRLH
jgi:hypothetical protein